MTATHPTDTPTREHPLMLSVSGCRGIMGRSLTPEVLACFAGAFADDVRRVTGTKTPHLLVARDGRAGGHAVLDLVAAALNASGCDVTSIGVATTPTAGYAVRHLGLSGAIVATASHNPAEWNGLKPITEDGAAPSSERAQRIIERFHERAAMPADGWQTWDHIGERHTREDAPQAHVDAVMMHLSRLTDVEPIRRRGFTLAIDSVNCSGAPVARLFARELGCAAHFIGGDATGRFDHAPEPTADHLHELQRLTKSTKADVGFAQDPDADRLAIIDEKGVYIGEEYTLALCAMSVLELVRSSAPLMTKEAVLAANLSTSRMIDDVAHRYGASVLRTPVGEANVNAAMARHGALFGGEGNGGVIWPAVVSIRDSVGAMALVLALMTHTGKTIGELVTDLPAYAIEKRKAPADAEMVQRASNALREAWPDAKVDEQDGVRLDFRTGDGGDAWLHVRPSNTEPIIRLIAEAPTAHEARAILDRATAAMGKP
jgi:phosphomannomutase